MATRLPPLDTQGISIFLSFVCLYFSNILLCTIFFQLLYNVEEHISFKMNDLLLIFFFGLKKRPFHFFSGYKHSQRTNPPYSRPNGTENNFLTVFKPCPNRNADNGLAYVHFGYFSEVTLKTMIPCAFCRCFGSFVLFLSPYTCCCCCRNDYFKLGHLQPLYNSGAPS